MRQDFVKSDHVFEASFGVNLFGLSEKPSCFVSPCHVAFCAESGPASCIV